MISYIDIFLVIFNIKKILILNKKNKGENLKKNGKVFDT